MGFDAALYEALLESALGVAPDEEPPAWRAIFQPTFHTDALIEVRGDELVLRWLAPHVRGLILGAVLGDAGPSRVVDGPERLERRATLAPARLASLAAEMAAIAPASLGEDLEAARDGIGLLGAAGRHVFRASSPTESEGPRHRAFFLALLRLAREALGDLPILVDLRRYFVG